MPKYMVFLGRRGAKTIVWRPEDNPIGVFETDTPQEAMQQASMISGVMGAFFAIEGEFWGVTPADAPKSFGQLDSTDEMLSKLIEQTTQSLAQIRAAGEGGDKRDAPREED